ncbi:MAG TPA: hypothetical protein VN660_01210 [Steroidobacteraceae bacterium]|nr:hypothetical protein [Steroidobacteraceae bacterium]
MAKQSQTTGGAPRPNTRRPAPPGEDAGSLTDEEYLSDGGPDALDAATASPQRSRRDAQRRSDARRDERTDDSVGAEREAHADSPPQPHPEGQGEDPERAGPVDPN